MILACFYQILGGLGMLKPSGDRETLSKFPVSVRFPHLIFLFLDKGKVKQCSANDRAVQQAEAILTA